MVMLFIISWAVANGLAIKSENRAWVNWKIKGTPDGVLCYGSAYGLGGKNQNVVRLRETLGCGPYSQGGTLLS